MISESVVDLSRFQFAMTAMYHFIFVPLTLGLAFILAIMETTYVISGKEIYKDMTKFWGKLFGINFALGVTTGLTMEFQFGTNWAYYSHYVGDIFGAPLAIEGLMAFFLESTFIGLFFFGWDRLSKVQHLSVTWLVALGSNLSALWILVANGWMQNPVGSEFNFETMRMELVDFGALIFNPVAQVKFVHTVSAGYVTGAIFVLAISSYYLLKKRDLPFARRSFAIAAIFGLASTLSVILLGDESGYELGDVQKTKLAAIESEWETHPAPAPFTLFGIPNQEEQRTDYAIKIPYAMAQTGWYVAEGGRQPWTIGEVLPTHLSASSLSTGDVWGSIIALAAFYTVLLIIEMYLMIKFSRLGPSSLHTAFSGMYWALLLVLFALFLRPVGFDYRSKLENTKWRNSWDWGLCIGGAVPALVFGVAFGNMFLGVPFTLDETVRSTYTGSFFALLNPFALVCGIVSLSMLCAHGGAWLMLRTDGVLRQRSAKATQLMGTIFLVCFLAVGAWLYFGGIEGYTLVKPFDTNAVANPLAKEVLTKDTDC
ncbi:hypothetical protein FQR65_LT16320 [Abscondita terminalis]|nr:hypothetical protein FQR65_LT16320 [Abscondita terminalis]